MLALPVQANHEFRGLRPRGFLLNQAGPALPHVGRPDWAINNRQLAVSNGRPAPGPDSFFQTNGGRRSCAGWATGLRGGMWLPCHFTQQLFDTNGGAGQDIFNTNVMVNPQFNTASDYHQEMVLCPGAFILFFVFQLCTASSGRAGFASARGCNRPGDDRC